MIEPPAKSIHIPARVLSFALFPLGLGAIVLGVADIVDGLKSHSWPVSQGTVLSSRITPSPIGTGQPEIRYTFVSEGTPHVSNQIWPGKFVVRFPLVRTGAVRAVVDSYPPGAIVAVHVKPGGSQSAIRVGPRRAAIWTLLATAILLFGFWAPLALDRWFSYN